ncbi:uncharacterized protein LOC110869537 [Helianthus annuus]|uniref:uncharacterized protein LOC110869537 n=1 Tax=Helianthus annuus TaxID=4232 RepID=UPI000B8F7CB4|nr:uncharacterized protein LOC110869537 [Helianthus annuus]
MEGSNSSPSSSSSSSGLDSLILFSSDDEGLALIISAVQMVVQAVMEDEGFSSEPKRRKYIVRDRVTTHDLSVSDYFSPNPTYDDSTFRRRFRMSRDLFLRRSNDLSSKYEYFRQRKDACGRLGFNTLQKVTATLRQLAYVTASDIMGEYIKMSERTARESLHYFSSWAEQYSSRFHKKPAMMLEAVAPQDRWIWHAFFGSFFVNGAEYEFGYYLTDVIYPDWAVFVKSFTRGTTLDEKRRKFNGAQLAARKDIERVLQSRWHILKVPCRIMEKPSIRNVMYACVILHNMILEDNGRAICEYYEETSQPTP